jgi:hypothetical protein
VTKAAQRIRSRHEKMSAVCSARVVEFLESMNAMSTRTVALSSKELDSAIEVLSSARHALQLTRFQRFSYFALMVTTDLITFMLGVAIFFGVLSLLNVYQASDIINLVYGLALLVCLLIGLVSLALNIPFLRKTFRETSRLKQLGLSSFYRSLWKESRRGQWKRRVREIVFAVVFIWCATSSVIALIRQSTSDTADRVAIIALALIALAVFGLLVASRYLRVQRERMDLAASAQELGKALQSLRHREGSGVVSVPASLLEQSAKIESAQIAEERKDAILESVSSRPTGYAIAFDRDAAEQRATLDVADRIELADLVAQLSTDGTQLEPQEGMERDKTKSNRVEIDYVIDNASRSIRVIAVRRVREVFNASMSGGSHA